MRTKLKSTSEGDCRDFNRIDFHHKIFLRINEFRRLKIADLLEKLQSFSHLQKLKSRPSLKIFIFSVSVRNLTL